MSHRKRYRAVWVVHKPTGISAQLLCENVRGAVSTQVRLVIHRMGVPRSECSVKLGRVR